MHTRTVVQCMLSALSIMLLCNSNIVVFALQFTLTALCDMHGVPPSICHPGVPNVRTLLALAA